MIFLAEQGRDAFKTLLNPLETEQRINLTKKISSITEENRPRSFLIKAKFTNIILYYIFVVKTKCTDDQILRIVKSILNLG